MAWPERIGANIELSSPISGEIFIATWRGNPRQITNKVSIHEFPDITGAKVQAQGAGPWFYPLTFSFGGADNDRDANDFMEALRREPKNKWRVDHPIRGPLFLTWLDAIENIEPVTSGNLTTIETNWVEGLPDSEEESAAQAQAVAEFQAEQANAKATEQFTQVAKQDTPSKYQSIKNSISDAITSVKSKISLVENFEIIDPQLLAIAAAIENTLSEPVIDTDALAGQMQLLVQLSVLGQNSATDAVAMFSDFANDVLLNAPTTADDIGVSQIAVTELVASAAIVAAGQSALIGGITSRSELVTTAQALSDLLQNVTDSLDETQSLYDDEFIDKLYWSQSSAYADMLKMTNDANHFLFLSLLGLPAERTIILKEDTFTGQIAKNEYGNINISGDDLGNLDKLITSTHWHGNDIYMQNAGASVLIYQ
jgi:hypothetical protein